MKPRAIIFDLDGTLCELSDSSNPYNHDGEEVIIPEMRFILNSMTEGDYYVGEAPKIIILTGRKATEYSAITKTWFKDNGIEYDELIMQKGNTAKKNHLYKKERLIELKERYEIIAMFDDNPDMIPVCKELGILMLHVNL